MRRSLMALFLAFLAIIAPTTFGCGADEGPGTGGSGLFTHPSCPNALVIVSCPYYEAQHCDSMYTFYGTATSHSAVIDHCAFDTNAPNDCGIKAASLCDGTVVASENMSGYGNRVIVKCDALGGPPFFSMNHFQRRLVEKGDKVCAGQPIGEVGETGSAQGCHIHLTVHNEWPAKSSVPFKIDSSLRPKGCSSGKECSYVGQGPDDKKYVDGRFDAEQGKCYLFGITTKHWAPFCLESHPLHKNLGALLSINKQKIVVDSYLCSPKWTTLTAGPNCIRAAHFDPTSGSNGRVCQGQYAQWQFEACVPKGLKIGNLEVYFTPALPNQNNRLLTGCQDQLIHFPLRVHCVAGARMCVGGKLYTCSPDRLRWIEQTCSTGCSNNQCNPPSAPPPCNGQGVVCIPNQTVCKNSVQETCDGQGCKWIKKTCDCGCDQYACKSNTVCIPNQQVCQNSIQKDCHPQGCGWQDTSCQYGCNANGWTCKAVPTCQDGATRCSGSDLETCTNNQWVKSACQNSCSNGTCDPPLVCQEGVSRCSGSDLETCVAGQWKKSTCPYDCMAAVGNCHTSAAPTSANVPCTANKAVCAGSGRNNVWLCTDTGLAYVFQRNCSSYGGCFDGKCVSRPTTCTVTFDKATRQLTFTNTKVTQICAMCRDRSCGNQCASAASSITVPPGRDFIYTDDWQARECHLIGLIWREERKASGGIADGGYFYPLP